MKARVQCCVPFCPRTISASALQAHSLDGIEATEWICAPHWRSIGGEYRRLYALRRRRYKRLPADEKPAYVRHVNLMWNACRTQAIEGAAGL